MGRKKYREISIDTAIELKYKNSIGDPYRRKSLIADKNRFFKKGKIKARNTFKESQNVKIEKSEYDRLFREYREKGLEESIKEHEKKKSENVETLQAITHEITEKSSTRKELEEKISKFKDEKLKLEREIQELTEKKVDLEIYEEKEVEYEDLTKDIENLKKKKKFLLNDYKKYNEKSEELQTLKLKVTGVSAKLKGIKLLYVIKKSCIYLSIALAIAIFIIFIFGIGYLIKTKI